MTAALATITTSSLASPERIHITNGTIGSTCHLLSDRIYAIDATAHNIACRIRSLTHYALCPLEESGYGPH